jgi:hypothetical protein
MLRERQRSSLSAALVALGVASVGLLVSGAAASIPRDMASATDERGPRDCIRPNAGVLRFDACQQPFRGSVADSDRRFLATVAPSLERGAPDLTWTLRNKDAVPVVVNERGAGRLRLGRSAGVLRRESLIGPLVRGCDLFSPPEFRAPLRRPLSGFAYFSGSRTETPLLGLEITRGAITDRGIRIGSTADAVRRAYPGAQIYSSSPRDPLQFSALFVSRGGTTRFAFLLDRPGGRVRTLWLPSLRGCE